MEAIVTDEHLEVHKGLLVLDGQRREEDAPRDARRHARTKEARTAVWLTWHAIPLSSLTHSPHLVPATTSLSLIRCSTLFPRPNNIHLSRCSSTKALVLASTHRTRRTGAAALATLGLEALVTPLTDLAEPGMLPMCEAESTVAMIAFVQVWVGWRCLVGWLRGSREALRCCWACCWRLAGSELD